MSRRSRFDFLRSARNIPTPILPPSDLTARLVEADAASRSAARALAGRLAAHQRAWRDLGRRVAASTGPLRSALSHAPAFAE